MLLIAGVAFESCHDGMEGLGPTTPWPAPGRTGLFIIGGGDANPLVGSGRRAIRSAFSDLRSCWSSVSDWVCDSLVRSSICCRVSQSGSE
jgi:hypothetical protein